MAADGSKTQRPNASVGSSTDLTTPKFDFRSSPEIGLNSDIARCPFCADIVAKIENRTTLKLSRKLIFGPLCCCVAFQRHCGGP
jgi:hypothetical protein